MFHSLALGRGNKSLKSIIVDSCYEQMMKDTLPNWMHDKIKVK